MEDRLIEFDLNKIEENILRKGFGWYLDGGNEDYLSNELVKLNRIEIKKYGEAAELCIRLMDDAIGHVLKENLVTRLGISESMIPIMQYDWKRKIPLICGRLDFAGGMQNLPIKLLEYNADTCTILPESVLFQKWMKDETTFDKQWNTILKDMTLQFEKLGNQFPDFIPSLLLVSLGHPDDELNLNIYKLAGEQAGFEVEIARLEDVVFADEGVFLEKGSQYQHFPFVHKLVPWEFIMNEEPELLDILTNLILKDLVVITNPSYSLMYQSKQIMTILYELFPDKKMFLPTYNDSSKLEGKSYVEKVTFGRQGENIQIFNDKGNIVSETSGDYASQAKTYQEYAEMITDDEGDIYQPGVFMCGKKSTGISFRRNENGIINDDSEFLGHIID